MNTASDIDETRVDVLMDGEASPDEVTAVEEVFKEEGIGASVRATYFRKSLDELPWVIFISGVAFVLILDFLRAAAQGAGREAGRDAYQGLRRLVSRLYAARQNKPGSVIYKDTETRTIIVLQEDLPQEAYRLLTEMGPDKLNGGNWIWDFDQNRWIDQNEWMRK